MTFDFVGGRPLWTCDVDLCLFICMFPRNTFIKVRVSALAMNQQCSHGTGIKLLNFIELRKF